MKKISILVSAYSLFPALVLAAPQYDVHCENSQDCPSAIAGLAIDKSSVCTGFLIDSKTLVTNFHCIPKDLQKIGSNCQNRIQFSFPKTENHAAEVVECDRLISISESIKEGNLGVDYAILKLAKSIDRKPIEVQATGFSDEESVQIYKIDPGDNNKGTLKKVQCTAIQNTVLNPYFVNDLSPVVTFIPCSIIKGNSGSPIMSSGGYVKGVLSAKSEIPVPALFKDKIESDKINTAVGSNFSCIQLPDTIAGNAISKKELNTECRIRIDNQSQEQLVQKMHDQARQKLEKEVNTLIKDKAQQLKEETHNLVEWTYESSKSDSEQLRSGIQYAFHFKPFCMNLIKEKVLKSQTQLKKNSVSYEVRIPFYEITASYDDRYRILAKLSLKESKTKNFELNPSDMIEGDKFKFNLDSEEIIIQSCFVKVPTN